MTVQAKYWPARWDELREWVMRRDLYRCQGRDLVRHECVAALHVHHVEPKGMGGTSGWRAERVNHPDNLLTVCTVLHTWIHEHPKRARELGLLKRVRYDG